MNTKYIYLILLICAIVWPSGCNDQENELTSGSDYTLSTQAEVDAFGGAEDIRTLTISGEGITDLSKLNIQTVKNLVIENTGIENLSIPQLTSITVSITIKGNKKMTAMDGLNKLMFVNGNFNIEDNEALTDISGLLGLKVFRGALSITGNTILGENVPCTSTDIGFCVIKNLLESSILEGTVTLTNNHPDAATDPKMIGQTSGGDIISYTILSKADAVNFSPISDSVQDLRISGMDITDAELASIGSKIVGAKGTVTIENTGITTTEGFFDKVGCRGSIILRGNAALTNPNGFKPYREITGDLIVENCPNLLYFASSDGTAGFSGITTIQGSLKLNPVPKMDTGGGGFGKLTYIGGNFEIVGDRTAGEIWNLDTWYAWGGGIKHIGGDLTFKNHYKVNGLGGFQALEYIGGDVYILDNGGPDGLIPTMSTSNQIGFCLIKTLMDKGVMKKENPVIQLRAKSGDSFIDINTLAPCE